MRIPAFLTLCLVLTAVALIPAHADKVWLENGNFLEGATRVLENGDVEITTSAGTLTLPASSVDRIESTETVEDRILGYLEDHPDADADTLYSLALQARRAGAETLARRLLEQTISRDPDHEQAREALGYLFYEGRWVTEEEMHRLRGEVRFRGEWVSADVRDRILREEAARDTLESARRLERAMAEAEVRARLDAAEAQRQRQETSGIPYWYVWAPSPWPVYPPGSIGPPYYPGYQPPPGQGPGHRPQPPRPVPLPLVDPSTPEPPPQRPVNRGVYVPPG